MDFASGRNRYIGHLISIPSRDFKGIKVGLDCANGSSSAIAKSVFEALQAKTYVINNQPDGTNINANCGSTHMEELQARVVYEKADVGLAFDGDADRMLAVDEKGNLVDGDQLMAICGCHMKKKGTLKKNTIVVTVMTNLGFSLMGEREGIHVEKTKVGDRYVLIFLDDNTTGDGLLSGLHLLQVMKETGRKLSELAEVMEVLPQALVNAKVPNHKKEKFMEYAEIAEAIKALEEKFNGEGRVLIRPSGTEPLVRVMIEGKNQSEIEEEAQKLAELITNTML